MKLIFYFSIFILSMAFCAAHPPSDLQDKLDTFAKGKPGGVALAWIDQDGTAFLNSGKFSEKDPREIDADTEFEIGSISKVFTALLLAESERAGKVSRHDPAAKYLLPPNDADQAALAKITLLSLTTHTSGLPRMPANIGANPDANLNPYAHYDRAQLIAALRQHGPSAPVGRSMAYSNFGVSVLGEALGAAWGTTYTEALQTHVLTPLGLKETSVGLTDLAPPPNLAPAHVDGPTVPNWTWQACAAAGGLRSSTRDLATLLSAYLFKTKTLLADSIEATLQPQHTADETGGHIALAWLLVDDAETPIVWHNGATAGSHSLIAFNRKSGEGLIILANSQTPSEAFGFNLLHAKPPQPRTVVIKEAKAYIGRYPLSPAFALTITENNGGLFAQGTGQPPLGLRQIAPDRFSVMGVPAEVSFTRDSAGQINGLILDQNGHQQPAPRQDLPAPKTEQTLSIEALHDYIGVYTLAPTFELTVTQEGPALFVEATGQAKASVYASAKDEFFYKVVDAQISFERDAQGKITALILHQNGRNSRGAKKLNQ